MVHSWILYLKWKSWYFTSCFETIQTFHCDCNKKNTVSTMLQNFATRTNEEKVKKKNIILRFFLCCFIVYFLLLFLLFYLCFVVFISFTNMNKQNEGKTSINHSTRTKARGFNQWKLTLSWRRLLSYGNQSIYLLCKSMDWFLYDNGPRHERVKMISKGIIKALSKSKWIYSSELICSHILVSGITNLSLFLLSRSKVYL